MDQEPDRRGHELAESPSAIRAAMAETRSDLSRHLRALKEQLLRPLPLATPAKDSSMQVQKKSHPAGSPRRRAFPDPLQRPQDFETQVISDREVGEA